MSIVRLEFEELEILRRKKRWNIYFIIVTEHPEEPDKMVISTMPTGENTIRIKPSANNIVSFDSDVDDPDSNGLFVLERKMPEDRSLRVRVYLRHSRKPLRNLGDIIKDVQSGFGGQAMDIVTNLFGTTAPWLVVAKQAFPLLGSILSNIKDKDFGFLSMDEHFGQEFESQTELDDTNKFSTGEAEMTWSWSIND